MRVMTRMATVLVLAFAVLLGGCGGGGGGSSGGSGSSAIPGGGSTTSGDFSHGTASCPPGNAIFTTPPIALASVIGWEPLGAMEPPGHTFPTDHQYLYFASPNTNASVTVPVVAPANMRIFMIYQTTGANNEFSIWIQPCAQIMGRLGSISALSSDLAAAAGPINQSCQTGGGATQCQATLTYDVQAGQVIGTISAPAENALDWWLWDSRIAPLPFVDPAKFQNMGFPGFSDLNTVPASAYFISSVTPQIDAKLGSFDGTQQRTAAPIDGTIAVDVAGTARGYWFNPNQAYPPENYQVALAPDDVHPDTTEVLSLGVSQANFSQGFGLGFRGSFSPVTSGTINRAFESLTPDGNVYCYQPVVENTAGQSGMVILQLVDASTLKIEIQARTGGNCAGSQPWSFTANAVTYKR